MSTEHLNPEGLIEAPSFSLDDESKRKSVLLQELKNKLNAAAKVRWGQDKFLIEEMCLIIGSSRAAKRPVLFINAKVFHAESVANVSATPEKWSSRIARWRVPVRHKMAYALRLIRSEMKLMNGVPRPPDATGCEST